MLDAVRPFVGLSDWHCHGWGIGWYENGKVHVEKEPVPAFSSQKFKATARVARSKVFVCHLRKATRGEKTYHNSQPYHTDNWVFGHNGTVDRENLIAGLTNTNRVLEGETDSEVYFHWLLQHLEKNGVAGLRFAIHEVRKREFTALNFVLTDGRTLYAYWEESPSAEPPRPDYYQLYYSELAEPGRGVLVCSEQLDDRAWHPIPPRSLLIASEQLPTQIISFR
jgi:glutamine amidotransferase